MFWWFFEKPPESKMYKLAVLDETGAVVRKTNYRIYRDLECNEKQAMMLARQLARDAAHHAGWYSEND